MSLRCRNFYKNKKSRVQVRETYRAPFWAGVEKMVFKVLFLWVFYGFLKTKNLERSDFFVFYGFLDNCFFLYKLCA